MAWHAGELQLVIGSCWRGSRLVKEEREKVGKKKEKTSFKIKFLKNYDFATDFFELQLSHHNFDLGELHVHELLLMSFMHLSVAKSQLKKKPQKSQKF